MIFSVISGAHLNFSGMLGGKRLLIAQEKGRAFGDSNCFLSEYSLDEMLDPRFFSRRTALGYFLLYLLDEYAVLLVLFISFSLCLWGRSICEVKEKHLFTWERLLAFFGSRRLCLVQVLLFPVLSLFLSFFYCRYRKPDYSVRRSFSIWGSFLFFSSSFLLLLSYLGILTLLHLFVQSIILSSFLLFSLNFSSSSPLRITYIFSSIYLIYLILLQITKSLPLATIYPLYSWPWLPASK